MSNGPQRAGAALLCALFGVIPVVAQDDADRPWNGFYQVREQFPLTSGYLVLEPISGFTLEPGEWLLEVTMTQSNTFSASQVVEQELSAREERAPFTREMFDQLAATDPFDQTHYLDTQVARTALRARRGLGAGFEIDLLLPFFRIHGGRTDGLVEGFHDLFGFDQEGRKGVLKDRMSQFVSGQGLELDIQETSGLEPGDLTLGLRKRVVEGGAGALAVGFDLKLPTGDEDYLVSSGGVDVGLSAVGSRCWRTRCGHTMVGFVFAGEADALPTDGQSVFQAALGFEQHWRKGWGLVAQAHYWQSYLDDLGFEHFAEDTIQLGVTVSRETGWGELLLGLSENSFSFKNSSDVTFHLGWQGRFK